MFYRTRYPRKINSSENKKILAGDRVLYSLFHSEITQIQYEIRSATQKNIDTGNI